MRTHARTSLPAPDSAVTRLSLSIEDMSCASCVGRVEAPLRRVGGVDEVSVNLATGRADVRVRPDVRRPALAVAAEGAGYHVAPVTTELAIEGMSCAASVGGVEAALGAVPGVLEAGVNPATERATVRGHADVAEPINAVEAAGYNARSPVRDAVNDDEAAARNAAAQAIARQTGVDEVIAGVLPEGKLAAVQRLRATHGRVAFVGDGIDDAPALAGADVGIAIEAADVVLMSGSLHGVPTAIALSRATLTNIRQGLFWAFAYNAVLIPVAAGALYPSAGIVLSPGLAAGAMALSSVCVVGNALRLRRFTPAATSQQQEKPAPAAWSVLKRDATT